MGWSRSQLRALRYLHAHRDRNPTIAEHFPKLGFRLLIGLALAFGAYYCFLGLSPALTWLFIGMLAGATLRDMRYLTSSVRTWPLLTSVIDWDRVRQMADENGISA